jgi:hypothetical protein
MIAEAVHDSRNVPRSRKSLRGNVLSENKYRCVATATELFKKCTNFFECSGALSEKTRAP